MCKPRIYFSISICSKYSLNYLFFAPCLGKIWCFHVLTLKNFIMREFFQIILQNVLTSYLLMKEFVRQNFSFSPNFWQDCHPTKAFCNLLLQICNCTKNTIISSTFSLMYWVLCLKQDSWGVVNKLSRLCHRKITTIRNNNPVHQVNAFKIV